MCVCMHGIRAWKQHVRVGGGVCACTIQTCALILCVQNGTKQGKCNESIPLIVVFRYILRAQFFIHIWPIPAYNRTWGFHIPVLERLAHRITALHYTLHTNLFLSWKHWKLVNGSFLKSI